VEKLTETGKPPSKQP